MPLDCHRSWRSSIAADQPSRLRRASMVGPPTRFAHITQSSVASRSWSPYLGAINTRCAVAGGQLSVGNGLPAETSMPMSRRTQLRRTPVGTESEAPPRAVHRDGCIAGSHRSAGGEGRSVRTGPDRQGPRASPSAGGPAAHVSRAQLVGYGGGSGEQSFVRWTPRCAERGTPSSAQRHRHRRPRRLRRTRI